MAKIDGTSELINALRSQLVARSDALRTSPARTERTATADATPASIVSIEELRKRLGREIRSLDLKLPENRRQARILFIESVIGWDFGDALLNDPRFSIFVRDVETSMVSDPKIAETLDKILLDLQTSA